MDGRARVASSRAGVKCIGKDKPPVLILAERGTGERHVILSIAADESVIRLLLANYH